MTQNWGAGAHQAFQQHRAGDIAYMYFQQIVNENLSVVALRTTTR